MSITETAYAVGTNIASLEANVAIKIAAGYQPVGEMSRVDNLLVQRCDKTDGGQTDYDADGATGTALAVLGLRALGAASVHYVVPDRFRMGYGLSPALVTRQHRQGETEAVNRHVLHERSDLEASLDELQMLCPNLEHVALVVAWFGDDLRAGECKIRPAVTTSNGSGFSKP